VAEPQTEEQPQQFRALFGEAPPEFEPPDPASPRGRIIGAARRLFAEHGFAATSIRSIANEAEVNLAMVNYYFGNKEALYRKVLVSELVSVFRQVRAGFPPVKSPEEVILSLPIRLAVVMRDNPIWAQLMRRELAEGAPNAKLAFEELRGWGPLGFKQQFFGIYKGAAGEGKLRDLPPEAVMPVLIALGYGMVLMEPLIRVVIGFDITDETIWEGRMNVLKSLLETGIKTEQR
jgi:AcrR family transcriptional regulator